MNKLKIVFMGTPDFAVASLRALVNSGADVAAVVTATDKMGGRGNKQLLQSAVKQYAVEHNIPTLQPEKLKDPVFLRDLAAIGADLFVVVAFRMLPEVVWQMPRLGTFNLHGSLLPKYRGAAPIHWAVINGEQETGVTTFFLKHAIDTGDILFQASTPIGPDECTGEVHDRLMEIGAELVVKTVEAVQSGKVNPVPQPDIEATHAPKLFEENTEIDFSQPVQNCHNFVRGLSPFPVAWFILKDLKCKVYKAKPELAAHDFEIGSVHTDHKKYLKIATKDGFLHLLDLQLEKRKRMNVQDFLNGAGGFFE